MCQDTIRNPAVMDFIDQTLNDAPFSSKHILNFLHNGPPEERSPDVPGFDWRDIFNLTDRAIRMLNQYGEVSATLFCYFILLSFLHPFSSKIPLGERNDDKCVELFWLFKGGPRFTDDNKVSGLFLPTFLPFLPLDRKNVDENRFTCVVKFKDRRIHLIIQFITGLVTCWLQVAKRICLQYHAWCDVSI